MGHRKNILLWHLANRDQRTSGPNPGKEYRMEDSVCRTRIFYRRVLPEARIRNREYSRALACTVRATRFQESLSAYPSCEQREHLIGPQAGVPRGRIAPPRIPLRIWRTARRALSLVHSR